MEFDIGTLSLIVIFGLLALISIGVPLGFASGFMGAVVVFLNIGEHALGILLSRYRHRSGGRWTGLEFQESIPFP